MSSHGRRGPKQLRFRALLADLARAAGEIVDTRQQAKIVHSLADSYRSAFAVFFLQDPSLLEFQRRLQQQAQRNNLSSIFDIGDIPSDTQLRELLDSHDYAPVSDLYRQWFVRLQRSKQLDSYRVFGGRYLVTVDGSEYFNSESISCSHCLTRHKSNDHVEHYHQVLQPALVHPDHSQVIPLAPEFIRRQDGANKQDCEVAAGMRALKQIRADHRQLPAIIVADALYSTTRFIAALVEKRFSYILGVKPASHKALFQDVQGLRRGKLLDRFERTRKDRSRLVYEWVHDTPLYATDEAPRVNFVEFHLYDASGKRTRHFSWVTDLEINEENVEEFVRAARSRWKIENENFNTLKNHGYHLEHNFGHGSRHLSEAFFVLNVLAFFMHQIFSLVDELYQRARATFSSRREYWNAIRSALRLVLFDSWDHLLQRIHGPPLPERRT